MNTLCISTINMQVGSCVMSEVNPHSGPNDYVFVYFADHGAPGFVAFPDDEVMFL